MEKFKSKAKTAGKYFIEETVGRPFEDVDSLNQDLNELSKEKIIKLMNLTCDRYLKLLKYYGNERFKVVRIARNRWMRVHAEFMKRNAQEMGML